ncbi:MAG: hypothetical protein ACQEXJ_19295 [Myxococcota bacterium]
MSVRLKATCVLAAVLACACGGDGGEAAADPDATDATGVQDVSADADGPDTATDADAVDDTGPDVADTTATDADAEVPEPDTLPTDLGFELERPAGDDPPTSEETGEVTRTITAFYDRVGYFDWLLRISHGVHESTGKRDFSAWWTTTHARKEGDVVTIVHEREDPAGGGHNMMTRTSKLLASNIAGYLLTGDETMGTLAEQYCKGVSATMLGMVYDEDDPIDHIMGRNVIPFSHTYTTHDGREKVVDYENWHREGCRWNTCRYHYPDNPYWGEVWVTALRSKDDVSRILRVATTVAYAVERTDGEVQAACAEAYDLLQDFGRDVVDSGYYIRSKDEDGQPYRPGTDEDPMKEDHTDISSYVSWEEFIPNAECNAKLAVSYLGYGDDRGNDCGEGGWGNEYEEIAVDIHYFNIWIIRSHHLAAIAQALIHRDWAAARALLEGLAGRYAHDMARDPATLNQSQDKYDRDLAASMMQAAALGYPLNGEEARLVQRYYRRSAERYAEWPHWDLWDGSIPDGSYEYRPPHQETTEDGAVQLIRPEDMAAVMDYCWSPFRNPAGVPPVDCELVSDPSTWDAARLDAR